MNQPDLIFRNIAFDRATFGHLQHVKRAHVLQHGAKLSNSLVIKLILSEHADQSRQAEEVKHDHI